MEPSNSNLEGPGQITIRTDVKRQAIKLEIHYCTIHLSSTESLELIGRLMRVGSVLYGDDWATAVASHMGLRPMDKEHYEGPTS